MLLCDNLAPLGSVPPGVVYSPFTRGLVAVQVRANVSVFTLCVLVCLPGYCSYQLLLVLVVLVEQGIAPSSALPAEFFADEVEIEYVACYSAFPSLPPVGFNVALCLLYV